MAKILLGVAAVVVVTYVGVCAWLYFNQRNILYRPVPEVALSDEDVIWLEQNGVRIKIWHVAGNGDTAIIYFGGNAEPVHLNLDNFRSWFPQHSLYLVNYRGYGGSTGKPTEAGLCQDANAIYDLAKQHHTNIAVMGRSLGSGVAVCLASQRQVAKIALVTPFDSISAVAQNVYPLFPIQQLLKDKFDSAARAKDISAPVLIMLAEKDRVVPAERGRALAAAFEQPVSTVEIANADHINVSEYREYSKALREFLVPDTTL